MLTYGVREALRLELGSERVNVVHDSWLGLLVRRCLLVWRFSLRHDLGTRFADVCGSAQGAQNKGAKECGRARGRARRAEQGREGMRAGEGC